MPTSSVSPRRFGEISVGVCTSYGWRWLLPDARRNQNFAPGGKTVIASRVILKETGRRLMAINSGVPEESPGAAALRARMGVRNRRRDYGASCELLPPTETERRNGPGKTLRNAVRSTGPEPQPHPGWRAGFVRQQRPRVRPLAGRGKRSPHSYYGQTSMGASVFTSMNDGLEERV
jgi:hypothetical protein